MPFEYDAYGVRFSSWVEKINACKNSRNIDLPKEREERCEFAGSRLELE